MVVVFDIVSGLLVFVVRPLQRIVRPLVKFSISLFCNNVLDKQYAANLANVRANWTYPTPAGSAYTHELPRDYFRYFGVRVAFQSL